MIYNAFTIDVEDYYMVSAFADIVKFDDWHRYESRVEKNTYTLLHLLEEYGVQATFFVLGWVAEKCPGLVRDIHAAGHEIACHGYNHRLIYDLSPEEFREDTRKAKAVLEDLAGSAVVGYRATSYSIIKETQWALDILIEQGFLYDSSIFPIQHDRYGFPEAERFPHRLIRAEGGIIEYPPSTYALWGKNIPMAGGGYLRLFPQTLTKAALRSINEKEKQPCVLYVHPWEIDEEQPRLQGRWLSKRRHYLNLHSTLPKLRALLQEFEYRPLASFAAGPVAESAAPL